jgi:glycosyltransferase involved in cell wall biosynthesis
MPLLRQPDISMHVAAATADVVGAEGAPKGAGGPRGRHLLPANSPDRRISDFDEKYGYTPLSRFQKGPRLSVGSQWGAMQVGVLIVAYNAAESLGDVLDRLPSSFRARVTDVAVFDDASDDATYEIALEHQERSELPLSVIRQPRNLGYGGNQKSAYHWAIERGLDAVVLLHGDGQYAPEVIEELLQPLERGDCDAAFGSRIMGRGSARLGGMPLYKYVGNRILSVYSNAMAGTELSEWHSGYRAYRVDALADIPFDANSDGFDFDTQIILQLHEAGKTMCEIAIPTHYGDEICRVNGLSYAMQVASHVTRYRSHKIGFGSGEMAFSSDGYELKLTASSSHGQLLTWLMKRRRGRVLDVGCSDGRFGELVRLAGHTVVGVDAIKHEGVGERLDAFVEADLNAGLPEEAGRDFDVVVAADVLEHVIDPAILLEQLRDSLAPGGVIMVSVPNFAHWYPRLRVLLGRFDYDRRGILDAGHIRFFTRAAFERIATRAGLRIRQRSTAGLPVEVAERGGGVPVSAEHVVANVDRVGVALWPTLFGYQFLFELEPRVSVEEVTG